MNHNRRQQDVWYCLKLLETVSYCLTQRLIEKYVRNRYFVPQMRVCIDCKLAFHLLSVIVAFLLDCARRRVMFFEYAYLYLYYLGTLCSLFGFKALALECDMRFILVVSETCV